MPRRTSVARTLAGALVLGMLQVVGCGTDAVGVDSCRRIELARCDAAAACGTIDDAAECRRFYHDQCLHGLPVPDPGTELVAECEATLQRAGACAAEGVDLSLEECSDAVTSEPTYASTACEIVSEPQLAAECRFLSPSTEPPQEPEEPEEPEEPGAGGSSGGSSGESGAPGETPSEAGASAGGSGGAPIE
ncbi:MAG: hypothetical protein M3020_27750 [Myxococcota bacterium]|nr:hypothetical protein [Myxococcota bacterium]